MAVPNMLGAAFSGDEMRLDHAEVVGKEDAHVVANRLHPQADHLLKVKLRRDETEQLTCLLVERRADRRDGGGIAKTGRRLFGEPIAGLQDHIAGSILRNSWSLFSSVNDSNC